MAWPASRDTEGFQPPPSRPYGREASLQGRPLAGVQASQPSSAPPGSAGYAGPPPPGGRPLPGRGGPPPWSANQPSGTATQGASASGSGRPGSLPGPLPQGLRQQAGEPRQFPRGPMAPTGPPRPGPSAGPPFPPSQAALPQPRGFREAGNPVGGRPPNFQQPGRPQSHPPAHSSQPDTFQPPRPGYPAQGQQLNYGVQRPSMPQPRPGAMSDRSSSGATSRIDPATMPRPLPRPESAQSFPTRQDGKAMLPLPADHPVSVRDMGNCSPRNMRVTLNCVPATNEMQQQSNMPLAVLMQPLASAQADEEPLCVVDMGEAGPVRCSSCKAYINPFMQFIEYGRKFVCNFCGTTNTTPHDYVENIGVDGRRRDADERAELSRGSVEFVAPPQFMVRPPMAPTHFFLIDVTHAAITSGATAAACHAIAGILDNIQGGERARVGFATFDSSVHFYSIRHSQSQPQMLVVPDADEPYCPLPGSLLGSLTQSRRQIDALLKQIPDLFAESNILDSCGTGAIEACIAALKGGAGGKLHIFMSCLPKVGAKALIVRDQGGKTNEKEPMKVMEPAKKEYRQLAEAAAEGMVSMDLFLLTQSFIDVATLGTLSSITSGQLYLYQPFAPDIHGDEFYNDLRWNILRPQGWEAVGRLRVSNGLVIERYFGSMYRRTMTDVDMATVNCDSSIAAELRHSDSLSDAKEAYLQFALVYTNSDGQRRIRVHTLGLPVTSVMGTVFRGADADSQINFLGRRLAYQVPGGKLATIKEQAYQYAVDVLFTYRSKCATASASGQLILPESLKLLPLYGLALTKTPAFRSNAKADVRAAWTSRILNLPPQRTLPLVYPRLFALAGLLSETPSDLRNIALPPPICYLSASKLEETGIFLLENGYEAFLQIGERVAPELLVALIGVPSLDAASPNAPRLMSLPTLNTPQNAALHSVMSIVRQQRGRFLPLLVMPNLPAYMSPFYASLIEDKVEGKSYVEHLCAVHRDIQRKFS